MASPKKTLSSRIVVPGVRTPSELGKGRYFLLFGDPKDIVRFLNREGFTSHSSGQEFTCAQDVNAIMMVAHK